MRSKIGKWMLIAFGAAMAIFIIWNLHHANEIYERSREIAERADATIARSEESLARRIP